MSRSLRKFLTVVLISLFISGVCFSAASAAAQLKNFNDIMAALKSGRKVRAVFYYAKCQLISDNEIKAKSPDAIGGMTIDTFEYFAKNTVKSNSDAFVVASVSTLIANPLGKGHVYNYVKMKISEDGKIRITARYLDPKTFEENMDESFYTDLNAKDPGAKFYLCD